MIDHNALLTAFVLFLPAGFANMTPVFASRTPGLKNWTTPLDFGKTWRGKRIFGANKTWRGLLAGTLVGGLVYALELVILRANPGVGAFMFGALLGFGALMGDAVESFFKRQRNVPAGHPWFPFDQIDYLIGSLVVAWPAFVRLPFGEVVLILLIFFGLHIAVVFIGYQLGIRDKPI